MNFLEALAAHGQGKKIVRRGFGYFSCSDIPTWEDIFATDWEVVGEPQHESPQPTVFADLATGDSSELGKEPKLAWRLWPPPNNNKLINTLIYYLEDGICRLARFCHLEQEWYSQLSDNIVTRATHWRPLVYPKPESCRVGQETMAEALDRISTPDPKDQKLDSAWRLWPPFGNTSDYIFYLWTDDAGNKLCKGIAEKDLLGCWKTYGNPTLVGHPTHWQPLIYPKVNE